MNVKHFIEDMQLKVIAGDEGLENPIQGGYVGDLLSFVMAHAKENQLWITIQGHLNTVAVASLIGISGIILAENVPADEEMLKKADELGIPVISTSLSSFDMAHKLYEWMSKEEA